MEELITFHHSNFMILGERAKEYAWRTGCSNWVADQTLRSQLFLHKIKKECMGWNTACRQEWNLFLLERMFCNAAAVWHKELQRCPCGIPLEPSETALEHPSVQTMVGFRDADVLQVAEQIYKGKYVVAPVCSPMPNVTTSWRSYERRSPSTWPALVYKVKGGQLECPLGARGDPKVWKKMIKPLRQGSMVDCQSQGEEPVLGEGLS